MEKEAQTYIVHNGWFRERKCFSDKLTKSLSQRVIKALYMCRFARFLAYSSVLFLWNHCLIGIPKIGITVSKAFRLRKRVPQSLAGSFTPITYYICYESLVFFDREPSIPRLSSLFLRQMTKVHQPLVLLILGQMHQGKAAFHLHWVIRLLFFNHSLTVLRVTPNVLVNPLKLLRSSYDLSISSRLSFEYAYGVGFSRLCFLHSLQ